MSDFIIDEFYREMKNVNFDVFGILDSTNKIHTLGTDSKLIGRIFEMYTEPILNNIAKRHNLILETPDKQNYYPDFIMMEAGKAESKIAIDVKTSYVTSDNSVIKFTLGAFGSYMRDNKKNIVGKYTDYTKHYTICFVYKRNGRAQESQVFEYGNRDNIEFPFYDVKYCIQEKYKIAGDKPGSGNTENIGSISTRNFSDLAEGKGPFADLGVDAFDVYWKYYPKYRSTYKNYSSLHEFLEWFVKQPPENVKLLHEYNYNNTLNKITNYLNEQRK